MRYNTKCLIGVSCPAEQPARSGVCSCEGLAFRRTLKRATAYGMPWSHFRRRQTAKTGCEQRSGLSIRPTLWQARRELEIPMKKTFLFIVVIFALALGTQQPARAGSVSFGFPLPFPFAFYNFGGPGYYSRPCYGGYWRRPYYRAYYYHRPYWRGYYRPYWGPRRYWGPRF